MLSKIEIYYILEVFLGKILYTACFSTLTHTFYYDWFVC